LTTGKRIRLFGSSICESTTDETGDSAEPAVPLSSFLPSLDVGKAPPSLSLLVEGIVPGMRKQAGGSVKSFDDFLDDERI
jgi:hypothetical protein